MAQVLPFSAIRYAQQYSRPTVFAPPFDIVTPADRALLLDIDPFNAVRITVGDGTTRDWHAEAAHLLGRWVTDGVLIRDRRPGFYGYRQRFVHPDGQTMVRTGFIGRVQLRNWGDGIYRHEHTRDGPRADRLRLLRATRTNLSPVFGLYRDLSGDVKQHLEAPSDPLLDFQDGQGVGHQLWRIDQPSTVSELTRLLRDKDIVIADGHHRYETALAYRDEMRAHHDVDSEPRSHGDVMMYLTSANDPGLRILATHRTVSNDVAVDWQRVLRSLRNDFAVQQVGEDRSLSAAITDVGEGGIAIGAHLGEAGTWILKLKDSAYAKDPKGQAQSNEMDELDVIALQRRIFEPHLGISPDRLAATGAIRYTTSEHEALDEVRSGQAQAAFILNPTSIDQVWQAAVRGVTMPPKSTYFYPKLLTGLVFRPLDAR